MLKTIGRRLGLTWVAVRGALDRAKRDLRSNDAANIRLLVRYSVVFRTSKGFKLRNKSGYEEYLARLFSPDRLAARLRFLEEILLPSLAAQTLPMKAGRRELVLYTSTLLPDAARRDLEAAIASYDWARIEALSPDTERLPAARPTGLLATVRIDDDDAVARDYMERLSCYVRPEYAGSVITFPRGFYLRTDNLSVHHVYQPLLGLGLAYISSADTKFETIFQLGGHNETYRKAPVIVDAYAPAFVRSVHSGSDSGAWPRFYHRRSTMAEVLTRVDIRPTGASTSTQPARADTAAPVTP